VWAIRYIGAIMRYNANNYKKYANGYDLSNNVPILCVLYNEGDSVHKAQTFGALRKQYPDATPQLGASMGPWVRDYLPWIKSQLTCPE